MLFENQRGDVGFGSLAVVLENHAVDDGKVKIRIVARDRLHDRPLRKAHTDYQIIVALGKRTHGRFDRNRIARLDVAQDYVEGRLATTGLAIRQEAGLGAFHARPGGGVE